MDDDCNIGMPGLDYWKSMPSEMFEEFKRHPLTLMFHPELYEEGERERISNWWNSNKQRDAGSPTASVEIPNGGNIKEKTMTTQTAITRAEHRGTACVYFDPRGRAYPALITEVWGPQCVNVVYVNDVEEQRDSYGQKLLRATSVMHGGVQQAHGNYWLLLGETRVAPQQPADSAT